MGALLRWLFLTAPARLFKRGEETGGPVPFLYLFVVLVALASGAALGWLVGWLVGDPDAGTGLGVIAGGTLVTGWFAYVLVLVGVMRLRGRPMESLVGEGWLQRSRHWYEK